MSITIGEASTMYHVDLTTENLALLRQIASVHNRAAAQSKDWDKEGLWCLSEYIFEESLEWFPLLDCDHINSIFIELGMPEVESNY